MVALGSPTATIPWLPTLLKSFPWMLIAAPLLIVSTPEKITEPSESIELEFRVKCCSSAKVLPRGGEPAAGVNHDPGIVAAP